MGNTAASMAGQAAANQMPQQQSDEDKSTWYCRMLARVIGIFAGLLCLILGLWACISLSAICIASGFVQMVIGFLVIALEAPCCCMWFDFIDRIGQFSESRPNWQKAFLYGFMGIIPMIMCFGLSSAFGGGMVFVCGAFYGMMALGKKADLNTMMARAGGEGGQGGGAPTDAWDTNLVDKQKNPTQQFP